jgi:membrane protein
VLVVATVLAKAMMGSDFEQFLGDAAQWFADQLGLSDIKMAGAAGEIHLEDWLTESIVAPAMSIDWRALGWIGVGVVIYAAIGLMVTIEKSFNAVLRAPEGRQWMSRVTIYWTVLTVSPLVIAMTLGIDRWFQGMASSVSQAEAAGALKWLLRSANVLWSFCATWIFMTVVYKLVPNTTVRLRAAMTGAFVAAVLLEIGKRTLGVYVTRPLTINVLYGSLGLIPLFMFWVYLMWLVVLFGLEVTAILQLFSGRTMEEMERQRRRGPEMIDPAAILGVMEITVERFEAGKPTPPHIVSETTGLPESAVRGMFERLVETGLVHQVERPEAAYVLATPPDKLDAQRVMDIGFALADEMGTHRSALLQHIRDAQRAAVAKSTLAGQSPAV